MLPGSVLTPGNGSKEATVGGLLQSWGIRIGGRTGGVSGVLQPVLLTIEPSLQPHKTINFNDLLLFSSGYVSPCGYVHLIASACGGQRCSIPLKLELTGA